MQAWEGSRGRCSRGGVVKIGRQWAEGRGRYGRVVVGRCEGRQVRQCPVQSQPACHTGQTWQNKTGTGCRQACRQHSTLAIVPAVRRAAGQNTIRPSGG